MSTVNFNAEMVDIANLQEQGARTGGTGKKRIANRYKCGPMPQSLLEHLSRFGREFWMQDKFSSNALASSETVTSLEALLAMTQERYSQLAIDDPTQAQSYRYVGSYHVGSWERIEEAMWLVYGAPDAWGRYNDETRRAKTRTNVWGLGLSLEDPEYAPDNWAELTGKQWTRKRGNQVFNYKLGPNGEILVKTDDGAGGYVWEEDTDSLDGLGLEDLEPDLTPLSSLSMAELSDRLDFIDEMERADKLASGEFELIPFSDLKDLDDNPIDGLFLDKQSGLLDD